MHISLRSLSMAFLPGPALIVLSGGADSTTCLYWVKALYPWLPLHAVTFNYNQRHAIEIESARKIAEMAKASHEVVDVGPILVGSSPLISDRPVGQYSSVADLPGGVEPTFVPGRNILFLLLAANRAFRLGIRNLVTGLCQEDFGGYPDCRRTFVDSMETTLGQGFTGKSTEFRIHTPLMYLTKEQSTWLAASLPGCMEALAFSHTCYNGAFPPCGKCHACLLRAKGFTAAQLQDPLLARAAAGK